MINTCIPDSEVQTALQQLLDDPESASLIGRIYPDADALCATFAKIHTVDEFQWLVMRSQVERIVHNTTDGFTSQYSPQLTPGTPYLFISNHRDIVLDAMLLDYMLINAGFTTPYVIFGANLFRVPLMATLGRFGKLVSMQRGGSPRDFYRELNDISHFIRTTIVDNRQSIWLAQRNGRTKDGCDRTDSAIVKMLGLSASRGLSLTEALQPLHIVPVAISYEWEPCDLLKVRERCAPQPYVKGPNDDTVSVITGFTQAKGHVHLAVGDPIADAEIAACDNDPHRVADLIDSRIHSLYHPHPTNHAALRLLDNPRLPEMLQSDSGLSDPDPSLVLFRDKLAQLATPEERTTLLELYANPLRS